MIDLDGLQVAYLGVALAHYLDLETGDILDLPLDADAPGDESRFRRIPVRTPESEAAATFQEATRQFQARLVQATLETNNWNVVETARRLDITRSHVYNLIRAFGLKRTSRG